jgi:uncharacterized membrane protein
MTKSSAFPPRWIIAGIDFRNLIWVALVLIILVMAIITENDWLLRFIHIVSGVLLTGADILFGFLVGPIVRRMSFEARREFTLRMLPKTLFILTTLGIVAPTSGWFLAVHMGFSDLGYPEFWWVIAALVIATIMGVQGLFILLPANLRAYFEMRKDNPDPLRVGRILRLYFYVIASQGILQIAIIIVMVQFASGL